MPRDVRDISTLTVLPPALDHPEGVAWGPDGKVYAGGEAGQIYRIDIALGTHEMIANTGGSILGLALDASANVYACDMARKGVLRIAPDGRVSTCSTGNSRQRMCLPDYPVFDDAGNLYVSDSGDWGLRNGFIWRISPGADAAMWDRQACGFTNGMCLSEDGCSLYVVESSPPLVSRIPLLRDGSPGKREVLIELPRTVPDGIAMDREGGLCISLYNPNIIYYFRAGKLETLYDDWEQLKLIAPTNVAFAGQDMKTLVIANLCGVNLLTAPMDLAGLPLRYPVVQDA